MTGFDTWVATILFGFQIYFDFSAYSDIAIGSANLLGIKFPENFNWPYIASHPKDFWKRWHISLSSWIRDYLYLPLTGQKFQTNSMGGISEASGNGKVKALFLTWFIMGLWHGASWNFALWGLYHAVVIFIFRKVKVLSNLSTKFPRLFWPFMFLIIMAGWIPFRADDLASSFLLFFKNLEPLFLWISISSSIRS